MKTTNVSFSEFQNAIFSAVSNNNGGNIIVNAVAGSGKTFTIVEACRRLGLPKEQVLFLAFNKSITEELETKIGAVATVKTTHSFGYSVIRSASKRRVYLDNKKYTDLLKQRNAEASSDEIGNAKALFDLCRVNLIKGGDYAAISNTARFNNVNVIGDEIAMVSDLLNFAYKLQPNNLIDFTDMLVLATTQYARFVPTFKVVFIDECQDLNTSQRTLMQLAARGGRFIAVGDPNQAINGFAGADCESFSKLAGLPNTKSLPLVLSLT